MEKQNCKWVLIVRHFSNLFSDKLGTFFQRIGIGGALSSTKSLHRFGLKKWSKVVIGSAIVGGAISNADQKVQAGSWINRRGGWGNGRGSWLNRAPWNNWNNRGISWLNGGGGGGWANRRGGGFGWINRR